MSYGKLHDSKPARCPRCLSRKTRAIRETASGIKPWRCLQCNVAGYEDRVIGDPMPDFPAKRPPKTRPKTRPKRDRYTVR